MLGLGSVVSGKGVWLWFCGTMPFPAGRVLGLTRDVWAGVASSDEAGGGKHAARSSGKQRQAAGGRRHAAGGGELPTKLVQIDVVQAQIELHVRPVDAVHHGYVLSGRSRSVAERYLRRSRAKHTWRRRRAYDDYDDDDDEEEEEDEYAAQARSVALEGRYLEQV